MQDIWFGELRDRVKWGAAVHIAREHGLRTIIQVPYRCDCKQPMLKIGTRYERIDAAVWRYFSDLRSIERLSGAVGVRIKVFMRKLAHADRNDYIAAAVKFITGFPVEPKLVLLDPDTGIAPRGGRCGPGHVSGQEISNFWGALGRADALAVYQHAARRPDWAAGYSKLLRSVCNGSRVEIIRGRDFANDMAILVAVQKRCRKR